MNVHSHEFQMSAAPDPAAERHARILDAAERCFVRSGFHRTTMQDVAAEAQMSAGNLYRYFPSKDAIVAGLSERDRQEVAADFNAVIGSDDFFGALETLGRKHFVVAPREKAVMLVEIWAESTRNPAVNSCCGAVDGVLRGLMLQIIERGKAAGHIPPSVEPDGAVRVLFTVADGLFKRKALDPDFDGERELAMALGVFRALFAGHIQTSHSPSGASQ
ncbi:TetR/AcrR family transcriptional regulator [Alsobacter soli]|nr:TetR/AcrR family transcriptional regulator [Alsobacter soli]